MIIADAPFKRVLKIKKDFDLSHHNYKYILLYFERNHFFIKGFAKKYFEDDIKLSLKLQSDKQISAEIVFTNLEEYNLRFILQYYPLLIIYDKDRFESIKYNYTNLRKIFNKVLNRKYNTYFIEKIDDYLSETMTYQYIVENKDKYIEELSKIFILNNILKEFNSLDYLYLSKDDIKTIKNKIQSDIKIIKTNIKELSEKVSSIKDEDEKIKIEEKIDTLKLTIEDLEEYSKLPIEEYIQRDYKNFAYINGYYQKKNINNILKKYKCEELKNFFYFKVDENDESDNPELTEDLERDRNVFKPSEIKDMISALSPKKDKTIESFYIELLKEIEFTNLYEYTYTLLEENEYNEMFEKLYSSIEKNKITSLSTKSARVDILRELSSISDFDMDCFIQKELNKEYRSNIYINGAINKELIVEELKKELSNDYSEFRMIESYVEDRINEIEERIEELEEEFFNNLRESLKEDYIDDYIDNLSEGQTKHSKYQK